MNKIIKFYLHKAATSYFNYIILAFLFIILIATNLVIKDTFGSTTSIKNGNDFINTPIYWSSLVPLIIIIIFALVLAINIYQSNDSWFQSDLIMMTKVKNRNTFIWGRMLSLFVLIVISSLLISFLSFIAGFIFHDLSYTERDRSKTLFINNISMWSRVKQMFSTFIFSLLIIIIFSLLAVVLFLFFKTIIAFISFIFIIFVMVGISMLASNAYMKKDYSSHLTDSVVAREKASESKETYIKNSNGIYQYNLESPRLSGHKEITKWKNKENEKEGFDFPVISKKYNRYIDPIAGLLELNHLFLNGRYQMSTEKYYGKKFLKETTRLVTPPKGFFTLKQFKTISDNIKLQYNSSMKTMNKNKLKTLDDWIKRMFKGRSTPMDYDGFKKLLGDIIAMNEDWAMEALMSVYLKAFDESKILSSLNSVNRYFSALSSQWGRIFKNIYQPEGSFTAIKFLNDILDNPEKTYIKYKKAYDKAIIPYHITEADEYMDIKLPTRSWMFIYIPLILLTTGAILIYEKKRNFN